MYYSNTSMTDSQLAAYAKKWCDSDGFFREQAACKSEFGFSVSGNIYDNIPQTISSSIDSGNPLILHCRGYWSGSNGAYHTTANGHFLLVRGYDSSGVQVADPGKKANNFITIPWEDLQSTNNDIYVRTTSST